MATARAEEETPLSFTARGALAALCAVLATAAPSLAAEERTGGAFTLGIGARAAPEYFGSTDITLAPVGAFALEELVLPGGIGLRSDAALPTDPGAGVTGAFRFVPRREGVGALAGLEEVGAAFELGAGVFRITERTRAYAEVRRGFGGHEGWVGEAGLDFLLRPNDRLVLSAGPRAYFGDAAFMRTYFGVTPEEAARSSLTEYSPDGGPVSLGLEVNARRYFGDGWSLLGTVGWRRLQGDAFRSPITQRGSADQFRARLILTRTFTFGH